jgi:flagellar hook-associated protein 3 FlgL
MFSTMVNNMNSSLAKLMELNEQSSSQKKINSPSDDPAGAAQVVRYNMSLSSLAQYDTNVDTATGWLQQADSTLSSVSTVLTSIRSLAEQAATGTLTDTNREQIAEEVRGYYEQLIGLANTEYDGQQLFGGQKTSTSAFVSALGVTANSSDASSSYSVTGSSSTSIVVQFLSSGAVGGSQALSYRYSTDGGDSWATGTLAAGETTLDLNGVKVKMDAGGTVHAVNTESTSGNASNGTWLWVRPTAYYQGDTNDSFSVTRFGQQTIAGVASGNISQNVYVRIDSDSNLSGTISYSYSTDKGLTWETGNTATGTGTSADLLVPGGYLTLTTSNAGAMLSSGDEFIIKPSDADINMEIADGQYITVNNVGKEVFGGIYKTSSVASNATAALTSDTNMFEVVGKLIGYLETNNVDGIQDMLADLDTVQEHVLSVAADVGGRENRLSAQTTILENLTYYQTEQLSNVEDVDITELLTKLASQQIAYQAVLQSTSTIMGMSLMDYM